MSYFNAHTHTQYSNITAGLDSINKLDDLVARAKELGLTGLAITNHDNLCEAIEINRKQKELRAANDDFVLAIGNEIYLLDSFDPEDKSPRKYYHFILIAKDKIGYDALVELSSRAWYRSAVIRGKRRVVTLKSDLEEIINGEVRGHIIGSTACLGGFLGVELLTGESPNLAVKFVNWAKGIFGEDDFYVELQPSKSDDQIKFNKRAQFVFSDISRPRFLITTDAHYLDAEDFPIFEAFLRSQQETREVKEYYDYARLQSEDEVRELLNYLPEWLIEEGLRNSNKIAEQIEFYDLAQDPKIPKVELPQVWPQDWEGFDIHKYPTLSWAANQVDYQTVYCLRVCLNKLKERGLWNETYLDRLEEEFEVFKYQSEQLGDNFFAYINTMQHYLEMAWSIDCAVGPSRGSASGCLINYLMDVVQCDPLQYDLPFWRFLNKTRVTPLNLYQAA